jgi:hypothetical protein
MPEHVGDNGRDPVRILRAILRGAPAGRRLVIEAAAADFPQDGLKLSDGVTIDRVCAVELEQLTDAGLEVNLLGATEDVLIEVATGRWTPKHLVELSDTDAPRFRVEEALCLGRIPWANVVDVVERDPEDGHTHVICRFDSDGGRPWIRLYAIGEEHDVRLRDDLRDDALLPAASSALN